MGDTRKPSVVSALTLLVAAWAAGTLIVACAAEVPTALGANTGAEAPAGLVSLGIATRDGANQTVHPDYVAMPPSWQPARAYLAITPYPNGQLAFENPSLYARATDVVWTEPAGVHNPLVPRPAPSYLSDPDVVFAPKYNELWMYYREVGARNTIRLIRSADGVHFTDPTTVVEGVSHTIVSPSVVRRGPGDWLMWSVNANVGCEGTRTTVEMRHSSDGISWSDPETVDLAQRRFSVWHIDVQWIPSRSEFWALYAVKNSGSCATPAVYLATSADGRTWTTHPSPVLARGSFAPFNDIVYRSTFSYNPVSDMVRIWYSGARYDNDQYIWTSAYERRSRAELFASIDRTPSGALMSMIRSAVPPLLDPP